MQAYILRRKFIVVYTVPTNSSKARTVIGSISERVMSLSHVALELIGVPVASREGGSAASPACGSSKANIFIPVVFSRMRGK